VSTKICRLRKDVCDVLVNAVDSGIDDDAAFDGAIRDAIGVISHICDYVEKHGDISLSCGSEWMYQSDDGQIDGLELVANILDALNTYADYDED
jgi:hypothetical protein